MIMGIKECEKYKWKKSYRGDGNSQGYMSAKYTHYDYESALGSKRVQEIREIVTKEVRDYNIERATQRLKTEKRYRS